MTPAVGRADSAKDAEALFLEARGLMAQKNYAEACPKLEQSEALDPGIGTEFNLARCYEMTGRLASAKRVYEKVVAATDAAGQPDREGVARSLASALETRAASVTVHVADAARVGLDVSIDGASIERSSWGAPVFLDPGPHSVAASAPDVFRWVTRFTIDKEGQAIRIEIPPLVSTLTVVAPSPAPIESEHTGLGAQRIVALILGGAGVAGVGAGSFYGLRSMSLASEADPLCPGDDCTNSGFTLRHDARTAGNVSTGSFAIGGALIATAIIVWLSAPSSKPRTTMASP